MLLESRSAPPSTIIPISILAFPPSLVSNGAELTRPPGFFGLAVSNGLVGIIDLLRVVGVLPGAEQGIEELLGVLQPEVVVEVPVQQGVVHIQQDRVDVIPVYQHDQGGSGDWRTLSRSTVSLPGPRVGWGAMVSDPMMVL